MHTTKLKKKTYTAYAVLVWYMQTGYRSISLPEELVNDVESFVKNSGRYKSISQFIAESVRLRLEELAKISEA
jgi:metal-responsive CopG/Arc/MetJ family transcriptional regulator